MNVSMRVRVLRLSEWIKTKGRNHSVLYVLRLLELGF